MLSINIYYYQNERTSKHDCIILINVITVVLSITNRRFMELFIIINLHFAFLL